MTGRDEGHARDVGEPPSVPQLPRDRVVYGNLRTSFVRFDQLLLELEDRRFDGYVEVSGVDYEGRLYMVDGMVAGGLEQTVEGDRSGEPAVASVKQRADERGGSINVFAAPAGLITLATSAAERSVIHEGLSTDFVDVDRLMVLLERDGIDGYVQFTLAGGQTMGYVFLKSGEVNDAVIADATHAGSGLSLVPTLLQAIAASGARIDVYRIDSARHGGAATPPVPAADAEPAWSGAGDLAAAWSAVLKTVEEVVDESSEPGRFADALSDVLHERAHEIAYLDPDGGQCAYAEGRLALNAPPPEEFSAVMGDCLGDAVSRISFSLRKVDLESCIQSRLDPVLEIHRDVIERHGIPRTASAFLAA